MGVFANVDSDVAASLSVSSLSISYFLVFISSLPMFVCVLYECTLLRPWTLFSDSTSVQICIILHKSHNVPLRIPLSSPFIFLFIPLLLVWPFYSNKLHRHYHTDTYLFNVSPSAHRCSLTLWPGALWLHFILNWIITIRTKNSIFHSIFLAKLIFWEGILHCNIKQQHYTTKQAVKFER